MMDGAALGPRARRRWQIFGVATLLTACTVAAVWIWVPPPYDTNDDPTIRGVLEGTRVAGQPPTGVARLPNALLGWMLVAARHIWPSAYAWDTTIAATLVVSIAIFLSLVWRRSGAGILVPLSVTATAIAALLPLLGSVQYAVSATMAGGAAGMLAWSTAVCTCCGLNGTRIVY